MQFHLRLLHAERFGCGLTDLRLWVDEFWKCQSGRCSHNRGSNQVRSFGSKVHISSQNGSRNSCESRRHDYMYFGCRQILKKEISNILCFIRKSAKWQISQAIHPYVWFDYQWWFGHPKENVRCNCHTFTERCAQDGLQRIAQFLDSPLHGAVVIQYWNNKTEEEDNG